MIEDGVGRGRLLGRCRVDFCIFTGFRRGRVVSLLKTGVFFVVDRWGDFRKDWEVFWIWG